MKTRTFVVALLAILSRAETTRAEPAMVCRPSLERHAMPLGASPAVPSGDWFGRLLGPPPPIAPIVVHGSERYEQTLDTGWVFALVPHSHGWVVRLYDRPPADGAHA